MNENATLESRVASLEEQVIYNSARSSNLFNPYQCSKLKGSAEAVLTESGFVLTATASTKYDGVSFVVSDLEPSTKYTVQFQVSNFTDDNKGGAKYAYSNAAGALVTSAISGDGWSDFSFTTGPEQTSTKLVFYIGYRNSVPKGTTLTFENVMVTRGDKKNTYIPLLTFKDEKCRDDLEYVKSTIESVKADSSATLAELEKFKTSISDIFARRNEVQNIQTERYSICDGVVIITPVEEKKRFNILSNYKVKHDGFLTLLNCGATNYSSRVFVNKKQIAAITDIFEYPVYKDDVISIDITPRGNHFEYLCIGEKSSNSFNFTRLDKRTCYISKRYGSDANSGTTPFTPKATPPFGDRGFDTFLFNGGETFKGSLDGARGHISSYGNGEAIFDSLDKFDVTYDENQGEYIATLPAIPGFLKLSEYEVTWDMYGYEWPTKYAEYYKGKEAMFERNDSYYCKPVEDGKYELHLRSDRKLLHVYAPTMSTGIRMRGAGEVDHIIVRNYSGFGINVYGTSEPVRIHDVYVEYIGGGFYSPNCRYGNGIQINAASNDNVIEDCVVHDCFDTGVTIQTNDVANRNTVRRCKSYNCFWNFEAYWGNDVTFIDCVAYGSHDMSNGYRGVNASTRNALYLVWPAGSYDESRATKFIRCYGAYSNGDGIFVGGNVNYVVKDCKVYGTAKKSKNILNTILKYEGNEAKYAEAIAIGNMVTQK